MTSRNRDPLDVTLSVFDDTGPPGTPLTASEVTEHLDCTRRTAYDRLTRLADQGDLRTKKIGARGRVWWRERDAVRADAPAGDQTDRTPGADADAEAVFVVDADGDVARADERAESLLGLTAADDAHASVPFRDADGSRLAFESEPVARTLRTGESVIGQVVRLPDDDCDERWASVTTIPITDDDDAVERVAVSVSEVTDPGDRAGSPTGPGHDPERELAEVFERIDDAFYAVDEEFRFRYVNDQAETLLRRPRSELLGESVWDVFPDATETDAWEAFHAALDDQEPTSFETYFDPLDFWVEANVYPSESGLSVYFRDITERKERERELVSQRTRLAERERAMRRAYEIIADPDRSFDEQVQDLLEVVRETVGTDYATLSQVRDDVYHFENVAAPPGAALEAGDTAPLMATICQRVIDTGETFVLDDVGAEAPELGDRADDADWGIACYLGSPVTVDGGVYGTFCFYDDEVRTEPFTDWQVAFVDLLSNWVGNELERQRYTDRLAALNELNDVARDVIDAVIDQSTREEMERTVCERLAAADSYEFAWIAEVDPATGVIESRTEAGIDGYLSAIDLSANSDEGIGRGPAGTAFRTGETQVSRDVFEDPEFEPWQADAERYGFRSSAAIPIVHEERLYGVLGLYSDRVGAFAEEERRLVDQLGEIVGHAISSTERKRALMSDEVVELEFRVEDLFGAVDAGVEPAGTITLDQTVPVADEEFLVYGTAAADATESLTALVEALPHWESVTFRDDGDPVAFELEMTDPPVLSTVASLGGDVDRAVIAGGDMELTVHLSPGVDVRQLLDAVRETYPTAEMVRRQQISRPDDSVDHVGRLLETDLTDRQRAALQSAYHAGFFTWPRESSGEDVASSLGVSPPTFHQHLRMAQQKVFEGLLD